MRHVSTPESRRKARATAHAVGRKQRALEDATRDITARVLASKLAPFVITVAAVLILGLVGGWIESIRLAP